MNKKAKKKLETAHKNADKNLFQKEIKINSFYNAQYKKINREFSRFYNRHRKILEDKLQQYKDGKITKDEYRTFMVQTVYLSNEWQALTNKIVSIIITANQIALESIVNKDLAKIYIDNYNTTIQAIGDELLEDWI